MRKDRLYRSSAPLFAVDGCEIFWLAIPGSSLGASQTGGTVIDWVMKANGVSFRHAVELLRADAELPPPIERAADDGALLKQVAGFYHETLKQSPEALEYLKKRGLDSPEMIERFQLGFANRTLGLRLPAKNRKAGAEMRGRLQTLGILRERTAYRFSSLTHFVRPRS